MNTFTINFWDVDGCMVRHQFPNGKQNADITKDPMFAWVGSKVLGANVNIMVSGRGSELKDITLRWWHSQWCGNCPIMYYVGVDWKHQETHDHRMDDYVQRKVHVLEKLLVNWFAALSSSNIKHEKHVYEDDENVLKELERRNQGAINITYHLVDKAGEVHDYP